MPNSRIAAVPAVIFAFHDSMGRTVVLCWVPSSNRYAHKYYSGRRMWRGLQMAAPSLSLPADYEALPLSCIPQNEDCTTQDTLGIVYHHPFGSHIGGSLSSSIMRISKHYNRMKLRGFTTAQCTNMFRIEPENETA